MAKADYSASLNAMQYLWVIEMRTHVNPDKWGPTVGCGLGREQARRELAQWKEDNPHDKFRLRRYFSERR